MKRSELKQIIREEIQTLDEDKLPRDEFEKYRDILDRIDELKDYLSDTLKKSRKDIQGGYKVGIGNVKMFSRIADEIKGWAKQL